MPKVVLDLTAFHVETVEAGWNVLAGWETTLDGFDEWALNLAKEHGFHHLTEEDMAQQVFAREEVAHNG